MALKLTPDEVIYQTAVQQITHLRAELENTEAINSAQTAAGRQVPIEVLFKADDLRRNLALKEKALSELADKARTSMERRKEAEAEEKAKKDQETAIRVQKNTATLLKAADDFDRAMTDANAAFLLILEANVRLRADNAINTTAFVGPAQWAQNFIAKKEIGMSLEIRGSWAATGATVRQQAGTAVGEA